MTQATHAERGYLRFRDRRPRVLSLEDDPGFRLLLGEWLARDFEPILLDSPLRLFEAVRAYRPDAITLDLGLPGVDGLQLCWRLRESPESARTPLIVLTAFHDPTLYHRVMEAGATAFLCKPLSGPDLSLRLWQLLDPPEEPS
jgi:two-component system OmpR family response regulator